MPDYVAPHWDSAALITIDVQADTLDGQPLEIPGTSAALPAMAALAQAFRGAGRPIVHIVRLYRPDGSNVDLPRREAVESGIEMLAPGSAGSEIAEGLAGGGRLELDADALLEGRTQQVGPNEVVIYKPRWGAFFKTALEDHLRGLGVSTLVFCGCNFPNCPRTSIYEASERDFRIVLAEDAISGLYDRGRDELRGIGVGLMAGAEIADLIAPAGNVETVRRIIAAFNAGGLDGITEFVHPDIEFQEPPTQPAPRSLHGVEDARKAFASFEGVWEEHRTEIVEIRDLGDDEILSLTVEHYRGRGGMEVSQQAGAIYTLTGGKLIKLRSFWEQDQALEAAGLREY